MQLRGMVSSATLNEANIPGGHCKPITFIGYRAWARQHGKEVANHLLEFEEAALGHYVKLVQDEDIDCDLNVTRAIDTFFLEDDARRGQLDFEARTRDFPESVKKADLRFYTDKEWFANFSGVKGGHAGASYPAGHLYPYKLATGRESTRRHLKLTSSDSAVHGPRYEHADLHSRHRSRESR